MTQVPRVQAGPDVQRQRADSAGHPEAALLHRQRRRDVQIRPQLPAHTEARGAFRVHGI